MCLEKRKEAKVYASMKWKFPASETLHVNIVIFLHKKEMIMFNR